MSLEHAILGFLCEQPRTGYDLKTRCFDLASSSFWGADQAQIYRTLERLQGAELVTVTTRRGVNKPDRKVYKPTPAGRVAFAQWASTPLPLPTVREPLLAQVYLGESTSDEQLMGMLAHHKDLRVSRREALSAHLDQLVSGLGSISVRSAQLKSATIRAAIAREDAAILWADECISSIRSGSVAPQDGAPHVVPGTASA